MLGIGVDLVDEERIRSALEKSGERFSSKILCEAEREYFLIANDQGNFLAKHFAAKEAIAKALGTGFSQGVSWQDIAVSRDELGKPLVTLTGGALKRFETLGARHIMLSLSDQSGLVVAYSVLA